MSTYKHLFIFILIHLTSGLKTWKTLRGRNVTVSVIGLPPFVVKSDDGAIVGVDVAIVALLADKMGFNVRYRHEKGWKIMEENGTLSGNPIFMTFLRLMLQQLYNILIAHASWLPETLSVKSGFAMA